MQNVISRGRFLGALEHYMAADYVMILLCMDSNARLRKLINR